MDLGDGARRIRRFRFGRGSARREIDEEIAFHLAMVEAELRAAGMQPEAARLEARRRFGGTARYRRECRDVAERRRRAQKRQDAMTDLLLDLRFAVRGFRRRPGFLVVAILTLAIGIAANATIFGMVRGILLAPLPYGDSQNLVFVWVTRQGEHTGGSSIPDWSDYRARTKTLVDIAFHTGWQVSLTGEGEPRALAIYAGVPLLLVALTLAASLGPVRRALRVDPAATLRAE
jgi:putative ABC transport system permease protein